MFLPFMPIHPPPVTFPDFMSSLPYIPLRIFHRAMPLLCFSLLNFCQLQCLMPRVVSGHTEVIRGQRAGSRLESRCLTHKGLINLRVTVVDLWRGKYLGNRWNRGRNMDFFLFFKYWALLNLIEFWQIHSD